MCSRIYGELNLEGTCVDLVNACDAFVDLNGVVKDMDVFLIESSTAVGVGNFGLGERIAGLVLFSIGVVVSVDSVLYFSVPLYTSLVAEADGWMGFEVVDNASQTPSFTLCNCRFLVAYKHIATSNSQSLPKNQFIRKNHENIHTKYFAHIYIDFILE